MKLDEAIYHAFKAHEGQVDKCKEDYIKHSLRVMNRLIHEYVVSRGFTYGDNIEDVLVVAILHDVWEDTDYHLPSFGDSGLNQTQFRALGAITRQPYPIETYKDYIRRVKENPIATIVKLADLEDNMSEERQVCLDPDTAKGLAKRYHWAQDYLRGNNE